MFLGLYGLILSGRRVVGAGELDRADGVSAVQAVAIGAGAARVLHAAAGRGGVGAGVAGSGEHLLALVLAKCFGRLGYFPALAEVPAVVVEHVRRDLGLAEGTAAVYASARTAKRHRDLVRQRLGVVRDPAGARKVAAEAIREAATRKNGVLGLFDRN